MKSFDPLVIRPRAQNYHWGKVGELSLVARLAGDFDPQLPYAELWYGSHVKSPSLAIVGNTKQALNILISEYSDQILGVENTKKFGANLPFLAKILSIDRALSIQAHPNRDNAAILHAKNPTNYPDANHKPEIAIALTEVELLHGWINEGELGLIFEQFPSLHLFLKKLQVNLSTWDSQSRKELVRSLFKASEAEIAGLNNMILKSLVGKNNLADKQLLFLNLAKQVELKDVGLLLAIFLRHLKLPAGQSMYTPSGEIHAYLSGELFECMANSDNVLRAGLTPKFQDVESLIAYGNFEIGQCLACLPSKDKHSPEFLSYFSQASEFQVLSILKSSKSINYSRENAGPELIVLLEGNLTLLKENLKLELKPGDGLFIPACVANISLELREASIARVVVPHKVEGHAPHVQDH